MTKHSLFSAWHHQSRTCSCLNHWVIRCYCGRVPSARNLTVLQVFYLAFYILFHISYMSITKEKNWGIQRLYEQSRESNGILNSGGLHLIPSSLGELMLWWWPSEPSGFFFFLHDYASHKLTCPSFLFPAILQQLLLRLPSTVISLLFFPDWCLSIAFYHLFLSFIFHGNLWSFSCLYIFPSHTWVLLIWVSLLSFHFLWLILTLWYVPGIKRL